MKTMCWKGWLGVAALAALLMVLPVSGRADGMMKKKINPEMPPAAMNTKNAKVIVTAFYADWCPMCHHMLPAWKKTDMWLKKNKLPVGTVRFVFSNKKTIAASKKLAAKENLSGLFSRHNGSTGVVFVLNANNHRLIKTIHYKDSAALMQNKIKLAIAAVNRSEQK